MQSINRLLQAGDFRAAHDRLQAVADDHPDYGEAKRLLAGTKLALDDATGAERVLREAAGREPVWPPVLTMLGELLANSGRWPEAEPYLTSAATRTPADPRAALLLARHFNDRQRPERALAVVTPFCSRSKAAPELTAQHVLALVALGRGEEAIRFYQHAAAATPRDVGAAQALTLALQAADRHVEAEQVARRAIASGCEDAALHYARARSLASAGQLREAEAALRECLHLEPRRVEAHDDLARLVWIRTGDRAETTALLDAAIARFANDDALRATKAAVLQGTGDARAAYACLTARVERDDAPQALLVRAGLAALEFDPSVAVRLAAQALHRQPGETAARKLMVAARLGVGDADAALPMCEALLDAEPDEQYLLALKATAWRMLGDERYAEWCDYDQWVVSYPLDPPPPWRTVVDFLLDVKRTLNMLHDALRYPLLFQSLRHGTETMGDLTRSKARPVQALFKAFDAPIRDYMARLRHGVGPLGRRYNGRYRFHGSWSVRLRGTGFHHNHVHPRGWISSACYIDLPDCMADPKSSQGMLTFAQPGILTKPELPSEHEVRPKSGTLVLFPSYFWHGTLPFYSDQTRLTVAFDAIPGQMKPG